MNTPANPDDPHLWSHITDVLPDEHPLAWQTVYCTTCRKMLHADNNECMQTWVETGKGPYCIRCFAAVDEVEALEDEWGLR